MMGKKKLSEIKAQLDLMAHQANEKSLKDEPILDKDATDFEKTLLKKLEELEREVKKLLQSKVGPVAKR